MDRKLAKKRHGIPDGGLRQNAGEIVQEMYIFIAVYCTFLTISCRLRRRSFYPEWFSWGVCSFQLKIISHMRKNKI